MLLAIPCAKAHAWPMRELTGLQIGVLERIGVHDVGLEFDRLQNRELTACDMLIDEGLVQIENGWKSTWYRLTLEGEVFMRGLRRGQASGGVKPF